MSVHIIAEAGSNYNGSVSLARDLNAAAAKAAADTVKYQIIYPEGLYRPGQYPYGHYDIKEVWRIREEGVMTDEQWFEIAEDAAAKGITFSASVFDTRGLDLICRMNPPYIKLASCDLNNLRFLREVAERGHRMIVSTGMSTLADIEKAVATLSKAGVEGDRLVLLHCVSAYPSQLADTNLAFIPTLKNAFGTAVGFSDHTLSHEAACAAVALGATWVEKHFTTDHTLDGFDHKHALEPDVLVSYVQAIRAMENSLKPKVAKIGSAEAYTRQRARRGIYLAKDLPAGHRLTSEDLAIVRPESPIPADQIDDLIGTVLKRPLEAHAPLDWADVDRS